MKQRSCLVARRCALGHFFPLALLAFPLGCGDADNEEVRDLEIQVEARFGPQSFECGATFTDVGTSAASVRPLDFRFYVHDVSLLRRGGSSVPFALTNDGVWQRDGVALLDFEDDTGTCATGSPETNRSLRGRAPAARDYVGVAFTLGLPESMNHLDAATAPAPLNAPGMWWSWQGGYKYMRVDVASEGAPDGFFFHLGGTGCDGTPGRGLGCRYQNLARVELESAGLSDVSIDARALYRELDVNALPDFQSDFVAGCMAFEGDPECPPMFDALALAFEDVAPTSVRQSLFAMK